MQNNKNILLATILSAVILIAWTWLYEKPRIERIEQEQKLAAKSSLQQEVKSDSSVVQNPQIQPLKTLESKSDSIILLKDRNVILLQEQEQRVKISNAKIHGSISLKGAKFDDLTLVKYFTTTKKDKEVDLLSPAQSKERYFADFGWISSSNIELPNPNTLWTTDSNILSPDKPITLTWRNSQNIEFIIKIAIDDNYMFNITQLVKNNSNNAISVAPYGRINKLSDHVSAPMSVAHEGPIGVFNEVLEEISYNKLIKESNVSFHSQGKSSWFGLSDKYWLSSIVPDQNIKYDVKFSYSNPNAIFNTEFIGQEFIIPSKDQLELQHHFFSGAKEIKMLDFYSEKYDIKLFDRAIDFGWFYFLTKPFFFIIQFLNLFLGNFGLAILVMTVLVKLALFPVANKSYATITRIKKLQPKIDKIKENFKDDKLALNREMMALYKKEGVNPASGCLPILIQIPIFFALYKVLFVTIDMRHAPFYGWIKDLSAPDPTSIFNLFGLLPFEVGGLFMIGVWPILMGLTMVVQQNLNPQIGDPIQAKIMKFLPYVLIVLFAAFPAGLLIYWTWSNLLSILQQWIIQRKIHKEVKD